MEKEKLKLAIFDLGNVVVNISLSESYEIWSKYSGVEISELENRSNADEKFRKFERGEILENDYFDHLDKMLGINIGFEKIREGWNAMLGPVIEQTYSMIVELKKDLGVIALTNTNRSHCSVCGEIYGDRLSVFDKIFISCELGMRKPEERIFEHVLSQYNMNGAEAVFFDDVEENIRKAKELGIEAILVDNQSSVKNWIKHRRV